MEKEEKNCILCEESSRIMTLTWENHKGDYEEVPESAGLYQLYGDSPVYGMGVLLYIGKSKNIKQRITDHRNGKGGTATINGLTIRSACVVGKDYLDNLDFMESLLIAHHKPSYNSEHLQEPRYDVFSIIYNEGERGALDLAISNMYWDKKQRGK